MIKKTFWKNAVIKAKDEPALDDKSRFRKLFQQVDIILDRHAKLELTHKRVPIEIIDETEWDRRERGEVPIRGQFQYEWVPKEEQPLDTPESVKKYLFGDWDMSAKPKD